MRCSWLPARPGALSLALAVAAQAGCGYTSSYVPPDDGRVRAIWNEDRVAWTSASLPSYACQAEAAYLAGDPTLQGALGAPVRTGVPVFVGVHLHGGHPPMPYPAAPRPAVNIPPPRAAGAPAPGAAATGSTSSRSSSTRSSSTRSSSTHSSSNGSVSSKSGAKADDGNGELLMAAAVVALLALPVIDVALSVSRPEDDEASVKAIDMANALTDLVRWPGSPCSPVPTIPSTAGGAP